MSLLTIEHSWINARLKPTGPCDGPLISIPLVGRRSVYLLIESKSITLPLGDTPLLQLFF